MDIKETMDIKGFGGSGGAPPTKRFRSSDSESRLNPSPSPVVHVRGMPLATREPDMEVAFQKFGQVVAVKIIGTLGQGLVEFASVQDASKCVEACSIEGNRLHILDEPVQVNYSTSKKINLFTRGGGETRAPVGENHIILLSVNNARFPINVEVLHTICQPFGSVVRIVILRKFGLRAFVEFTNSDGARTALESLNGMDIYSGCCTLSIEYARQQKLNVFRNDQDTWDYSSELQHQQQQQRPYEVFDAQQQMNRSLLDTPKAAAGALGSQPYAAAALTGGGGDGGGGSLNGGPPASYYSTPPMAAEMGFGSVLPPTVGAPLLGARAGPQATVSAAPASGAAFGAQPGLAAAAYGPPGARGSLLGSPADAGMVRMGGPGGMAAGPGMRAGMGGGGAPPFAGQPGEMPDCVLMIYNVNRERFTPQRLFNLLCQYGNVLKVKLLHTKDGTAMVQMSDGEACERVIRHLSNQVEPFGQKIQIGMSKQHFVQVQSGRDSEQIDFSASRNNRFRTPRDASKNRILPPSRCLHFFNTPPDLTEEQITDWFKTHEAPVPGRVKVFETKPGARSSLGLAEWDDPAQATEALVMANHQPMSGGGSSTPFSVKLCFSAKSFDN